MITRLMDPSDPSDPSNPSKPSALAARRTRRRGFTLVGMIAFAGFFLSFTLITLGLVDSARARLDSDRQAQQAIVLAVSGLDYAQSRVSHGAWRAGQVFRSPQVDGGWFEVTLEPQAGGSIRVRATGHFGRAARTAERTLP